MFYTHGLTPTQAESNENRIVLVIFIKILIELNLKVL